jgi:hypothetical protein
MYRSSVKVSECECAMDAVAGDVNVGYREMESAGFEAAEARDVRVRGRCYCGYTASAASTR